MAPEGLNKESRVREKTDLYSFAITALFLMFRIDLAIKMLFLPIANDVLIFRESLSEFPLLELIFNTLKSDYGNRPNFKKWSKVLGETKFFEDKITFEDLENFGVDIGPLKKAEQSEMGATIEIMEYFGSDVRSRRVNENEAWVESAALSHFKNLSLASALETLNKTSNMLSMGKSYRMCDFMYYSIYIWRNNEGI